jgi:hypothetical protein
MAITPEQQMAFAQQAQRIEQQLKALLSEFREQLDDTAPEALLFAENDLYDALDSLADFISVCSPA